MFGACRLEQTGIGQTAGQRRAGRDPVATGRKRPVQPPHGCHGIGQRQVELFDQRRQRGPLGRPFHHALPGRHERETALLLLPK